VNTFARTKPYNALPMLPPDTELETVPVLKAVARAHRRLAELKGRTNTVPNPTILLNTIALQEAKASSEIEDVFTTNDELFRGMSMDVPGMSPHAKEVLHYNDALWQAAQALREQPVLSTRLAIGVVNTIKENKAGLRDGSGTQLVNPTSGEVVYTPPDGGKRIRELLDNLQWFANEPDDGLDPLVKMAVIHYQFEAIHPFYDGNGRTGRILLILYLLLQKLLDQPILFLSRFIIENKSRYYRCLRGVTEEGAWDEWVLFLLNAVETTAEQTCAKIAAIADLLVAMIEDGRANLAKRTFSKDLIEELFVRPYCKIRFLEEAGLAKRVTAARYLRELETAGLVRAEKVGKEVLFINYRLLELLTR
jgi:cell filamentation protein, protein adenylyltransferase